MVLIKVGLIIYSVTCYLFLRLSNSLDRPYIPSIVGIVIASIHFCIPLETFCKWIFKIQEVDSNLSEQDIKNMKQKDYKSMIFNTEYVIENPLLKRLVINKDKDQRRKKLYEQQVQIALNEKKKKDQEDELNRQKENEKKQQKEIDRKLKEQQKNGKQKQDPEIEIASRQDDIDPSKLSGTTISAQAFKTTETLESVRKQLEAFSKDTKKPTLEDNKNTLKKCLNFSKYLHQEYKKLEESMRSNKVNQADLTKIIDIEDLMKQVNDKSKHLRTIITEEMIEQRKQVYASLEQPEKVMNGVIELCTEDKFTDPKEKATQTANVFHYFNWFQKYFNNYDRQLLENKDFQGNIQELSRIELLNDQLTKKRARLKDDIENNLKKTHQLNSPEKSSAQQNEINNVEQNNKKDDEKNDKNKDDNELINNNNKIEQKADQQQAVILVDSEAENHPNPDEEENQIKLERINEIEEDEEYGELEVQAIFINNSQQADHEHTNEEMNTSNYGKEQDIHDIQYKEDSIHKSYIANYQSRNKENSQIKNNRHNQNIEYDDSYHIQNRADSINKSWYANHQSPNKEISQITRSRNQEFEEEESENDIRSYANSADKNQ